MLKKILMIGLCAVLATAAAVPAQAVPTTPGWYVVSVCAGDARVCPAGPNPFFLGPHATHAQCLTAWALWAQGPLNQPPRLLVSDCIQY